jgi:protein subunit release factor B
MNLGDEVGVSPSKVKELRERLRRLGVDPNRIIERFVRGGGKGGQKINKTANCVQLKYGAIVVRCQRDRKRSVNRFLALRELADRIEMKASPATSARLAEGAKRKAAAARSGRRARARHRVLRGGGEEE